MKVYKMTLCWVDHDDLGEDALGEMLEDARLPNHTIPPTVMTVESRDIGDWSDDHLLNRNDTLDAEFERLFGGDHVDD